MESFWTRRFNKATAPTSTAPPQAPQRPPRPPVPPDPEWSEEPVEGVAVSLRTVAHYERFRCVDTLTLLERALVSAMCLSRELAPIFPPEWLIVAAWERFPESFSLAHSHQRHPDPRPVLRCLHGADGLIARGLIELREQRLRLTADGEAHARALWVWFEGDGGIKPRLPTARRTQLSA